MESIEHGVYRHYKGGFYHIIDTATHSETLEKVVVYRPLYGEKKLWVRPLTMFTETVKTNGKNQLRFSKCSDEEAIANGFSDLPA